MENDTDTSHARVDEEKGALLRDKQAWEQEHSAFGKAPSRLGVDKKAPPPPPLVPSLKTFQNDIAGNIRSGGQSAVSIALAKQTREHADEGLQISREEPRSLKPFFIIGIVVIFIIGIGAYVFATQSGRVLVGLQAPLIPAFQTSTTTPSDLIVSPSISSENQTTVDVSNTATALTNIQNKFKEGVAPALLKEIIPLTSGGESGVRMSTQNFFALWATHAPSSLLHILGPEFSIGIHGLAVDTPYLVFSVSNTNKAIASMLAWESALSEDFSSLTGGQLSVSPKFIDKRIDGASVRVASNTLLYTFPIKGKIIVTTDELTLKKVREVFGL